MSHERILIDPTIAEGAPIIRGSRVPVHQILHLAAIGRTPEEIVAELPQLELADVQAALAFAAALVGQQTSGTSPLMELRDTFDVPGRPGEPKTLDLNTILVVDDQEMNRVYMQAMFKDSGFKLTIASNGEEALIKARAELPFLILSDVQMPDMDGFEMCRQLKADEKTKGAAVIFVTAHHRSAKKVSEGLDIGADDYIFRPFERRELLSRVRAVARLKRAEEEARRQAQTVARRNEQLELLNELTLAVASSLNLEVIFASSMQRLLELLDAEATSLVLLDTETQELVVHLSSRQGEQLSVPGSPNLEGDATDWLIQERVPSLIAELLNDPDSGLNSDTTIDPHSVVCIPMTSKDQVIGAIAIINKQGKSFTATDWVLLNSAAGIVAVAVENARLLQNVQQQVADLNLLNKIGQALTSTLELEQILERTTELVQESLRAEVASLWLLAEGGQELVLTASSGPGARLVTGLRLPADSGIAGYVVQTGEPFFTPDVPAEGMPPDRFTGVNHYPHGSILCVPVRVKGQVVGAVQSYHQNPLWFDQNDLRLLYSVASSVGIAIENARLFEELREFSRQLEHMVAERTRQLAEEKDKTEAILASMADGLLVLDAENRILTANTVAESMLDFRLGAVRGRPIETDHLANPLWGYITDIVGREGFASSVSADVPDPARIGGVLSIQALAARVRDDSGQIIGTVIVLRDITALKDVERMKARFMTGITHELKTPLSVIQLHANNLQTYFGRLPQHRRDELLSGIQSQVNLLGQLVEDILALSRLDAGESRGERQPVNLVKLADEVVADLLPLADGKQITLHWTKPPTDAITLADESQIKRVLQNLVDNAIKYTSAGGAVAIRLTSEHRNRVAIEIADTGIGIPEEQQARIFDRFFRVDPSHTIPGTGLGLAIVKEIVTAHGGDIRLESTPGEGSTFTVTLPGIERLHTRRRPS